MCITWILLLDKDELFGMTKHSALSSVFYLLQLDICMLVTQRGEKAVSVVRNVSGCELSALKHIQVFLLALFP